VEIRDRVRELRRVRAKDIRPNPKNWRDHPPAQAEALRGILAEVGYADALLARELEDGTLELIDGHLRAETTPDQDVPVLIVDVSAEEADKLLLSLDPLAALATADSDKLEALISTVETDSNALRALFSDLARQAELGADASIVEDDAPEPLAKSVTQTGDLWILGCGKKSKGQKSTATPGSGASHRLMCGDSTNAEDVTRLMDGKLAALCATDPPYLVDYTGERPNDSGKDWSATFKEIEITDPRKFFTGTFRNVLNVLAPHAPIYCWHAHKRAPLIATIWDELGILNHQQVIWVKPTPVFGRVFWHFRHEPCMMGWRQGSQPVHDSDHAFNSVWEIGWEGKDATTSRPVNNEHPTQKPVEIFARPMRKHTRVGDIVFEPFCGSGSQIIAAEQLGRRCCAIEITPTFVDVAIRRWQNMTQREATLDATGQTWREVAAARGVEIDEPASPTQGDGSLQKG
jgi:DNA modification methylase